jgi:hypothetical protein
MQLVEPDHLIAIAVWPRAPAHADDVQAHALGLLGADAVGSLAS